jgi:hypothetical protein
VCGAFQLGDRAAGAAEEAGAGPVGPQQSIGVRPRPLSAREQLLAVPAVRADQDPAYVVEQGSVRLGVGLQGFDDLRELRGGVAQPADRDLVGMGRVGLEAGECTAALGVGSSGAVQ